MINNIFDYVKNNITVLQVAEKFPKFYQTLEKSGHDYGTMCPTGHPSVSGKSFKLVYNESNKKNFYICHSCNIHGGPFNLAQLLLNGTVKQTVDWFIKEFKLSHEYKNFTKHIKTPEELIEEENAEIRSILLEDLVDEGKFRLFEPEGEEALKYLVEQRKYDPELIKKTDFMYFPTQNICKNFLLAKFPGFRQQIYDLKLVSDFGDHFRIAVPFTSAFGQTTGLILRATQPTGVSGVTFSGREYTNQRWTSTPGTQKDELFGISKIRNKTDTILIVEGYPDATYLPAMGYPDIVAFGQARMGNHQLKNLLQRNIKNVILGLDNDRVGPENTALTIKLLMENGIRIYVFDPKMLTPYKDPDEFAVHNGIEAFKNIVNSAIPGELWVIDYFYKKEPDTPKGKTDAYEQAIQYGMYIHIAINEQAFIDTLSQKSGLTKRQIQTNITKLKRDAVKKEKDTIREKKQNTIIKDTTAARALLLKDLYNNNEILPFQEMATLDYYIYNKTSDSLTVANSKDKLENACLDSGIEMPDVIPGLKVVFNPQVFDKLSIENRQINLFTPTTYMYWEPDNQVINLYESCPYIMRLLQTIIRDSDGSTQYIPRFLNWLAYIMQYRTKSNNAWVLMGKQGTGKNLFYEEVLLPYFGAPACDVVSNNQAHSEYNSNLRNKLLVIFNEVAHTKAERDTLAAKLKTYITEPIISTREIYSKYMTTDNHMNLIFYSNSEMPVIIENSDRRYSVLYSDIQLTDYNDWNYYTWASEIKKEKEYFYRYLINLKVDLILATTCVNTKAKQALLEASSTRFESIARALINCNVEWFEEQLDMAYSLQRGSFGTQLFVTEEELAKGYMPASRLRDIFQVIYPDTKTTANAFTRYLKFAGIDKKQLRIGEDRKQCYTWKNINDDVEGTLDGSNTTTVQTTL